MTYSPRAFSELNYRCVPHRRTVTAMNSKLPLKITSKNTYTITELAREFDVTTRTIRFYEDQGLLMPQRIGRTRVYGNRDRTRLKLILRGKRLGFALVEIKELFDLYDAAKDEKPQLMQLLKILHKRRAMLEQQKEDIAAVLHEVDSLESQCLKLLEESEQL